MNRPDGSGPDRALDRTRVGKLRVLAIWIVLGVLIAVPVIAAAASPLLAWRGPVYIVAGFAGVLCMPLLLLQPLLAAGYLPGLASRSERRWHRHAGNVLILMVVVHVGGLLITSPPDAMDALLLRAPTAFSAWGVLAMWAVLISAGLAGFVRRTRLWRQIHRGLALIIMTGGIIHARMIDGTMEPLSKDLLCLGILIATLAAVLQPLLRGARWRRLHDKHHHPAR